MLEIMNRPDLTRMRELIRMAMLSDHGSDGGAIDSAPITRDICGLRNGVQIAFHLVGRRFTLIYADSFP